MTEQRAETLHLHLNGGKSWYEDGKSGKSGWGKASACMLTMH